MPTERDILNYVLRLADERGLNQAELADKLGTGRQAITNWIRAGRVPDGQLKSLSRLFGKSVDEILAAGSTVETIRHAGDRMRLMRKAKELTVEEVARAIGISPTEYARCEETGNLPPTTAFLELVQLLGVRSPHWLAHGTPRLDGAHGSSSSGKPFPQEGGKR